LPEFHVGPACAAAAARYCSDSLRHLSNEPIKLVFQG